MVSDAHTCPHAAHLWPLQFAGALAALMEAVRDVAGPNVRCELLRKESLAGLPPAAAAKVCILSCLVH